MRSYLGQALDATQGQKKEALFGGALFGHVATNAMNRAAHKSTNIAEMLAHHGLQQGLLQQGMQGGGLKPGAAAYLKFMYGPESVMHYDAANQVGRALVNQFPNPQDRQKAIQAVLGGAGAIPGMEHLPVGGEILKALRHESGGTAPEMAQHGVGGALSGLLSRHINRVVANNGRTGMETGAQKAMDWATHAAPLAAGAVAMPPMLEHYALNGARWAGSKLFGKQMAESGFKRGLRGEMPGQASQFLIDHLVSPAILDPQRAGHQVRQMMPGGAHAMLDESSMHDWSSPEGRAGMLGALKPMVAEKVNPLLNRLHGAAQGALSPSPKNPVSPVSPVAMAAGAALPLAGYAAYQAARPTEEAQPAQPAQPAVDPGQMATVLPFRRPAPASGVLKAAALKDQTRVCKNCAAEGDTSPRALCDECKCEHGPRMNEPCKGCGREKR